MRYLHQMTAIAPLDPQKEADGLTPLDLGYSLFSRCTAHHAIYALQDDDHKIDPLGVGRIHS